jgi:KipI family sensor histidine kinase inhibitor
MTTRLVSYGLHAVLAEYRTLAEVIAAAEAVRTAALPGVVDVVPAARTVLVHFAASEPIGLRALLSDPHATASPDGRLVEIPTRYNGVDLADIAATTGLSVAEVVEMHSGTTFTAAFCGFAPGFAYLSGLPPTLHLPRRGSPRTHVPAGTLAMASEFTGVYPSDTPGGWHLLGTVGVAMFDVRRAPAALIAPGDRVRFVPR